MTSTQFLIKEIFIGLYALIAIYLAVVFLTYHPSDPSYWYLTNSEAEIQNAGGLIGSWVSSTLLALFGISGFWIVLFFMYGTYLYSLQVKTELAARNENKKPEVLSSWWLHIFGFLLLLSASSALEFGHIRWEASDLPQTPGGILGVSLDRFLQKDFGFIGSTLILIFAVFVGFSLSIGKSWMLIVEKLGAILEWFYDLYYQTWQNFQDSQMGRLAEKQRNKVVADEKYRLSKPEDIDVEEPTLNVPQSDRNKQENQGTLFIDTLSLPPLRLLDPPPKKTEVITPDLLTFNSRLIERKLMDFGVQVQVLTALPGPVITRYELMPAAGIKGSRITGLAQDLARSLSVVSVRVVETIPGKDCMGIEIPNPKDKRQLIALSEIIGSKVYESQTSALTMAMGKDISGEAIVADLAKMPHALVAGTTGSGKSVAINAMILSLLYKSDPKKVRMILIDPKMLELSVYADIAHLLTPVITDMKQAENALNWAVAEMEKRYRLMAEIGVRGLASYNQKIQEQQKSGTPIMNPFSLTPETPEPLDELPFIVVVIDELADLMMVVGKKIEIPIARLAQKARACGIHLIVATQRPSVDVITGLIKANIPTRVAFQVSSKIDSRTILDQGGAESLLGQGDMLYQPSGTNVPQRIHGAFVSDEEVHRVVEYLKKQGAPNYIEEILTGAQGEDGADNFSLNPAEGGDEGDALYNQAVAFVLQSRKASISAVQRQLRVGYNRAARFIEQMEEAGIVTPAGHNGNREVIVPKREEN